MRKVSSMNKIPKTIHYCWFGRNKKSRAIKKCINSWKKYMPDYNIMEWNEDSYDLSKAPKYVQEAYEAKKYAFVSDYVRLYALEKYGGIYFDTDLEVIKNFDKLLKNKNVVLGFQGNYHLMTAFIACIPNYSVIQQYLSEYKKRLFIKEDGTYDLTTNPPRFTELFCDLKGLIPNEEYQELDDDIVVYPKDYFSAYDLSNDHEAITNNTYTIHHYLGTWISKGKYKMKVKKILAKVLGLENYKRLKRIIKGKRNEGK